MLRHSLPFIITLLFSLFVLGTSRALVSPRPLARAYLYKRIPQGGAVAPVLPPAGSSDASNSSPSAPPQVVAPSTAPSPAPTGTSTPDVSSDTLAAAASSATSSSSETLIIDTSLSPSSSGQSTTTSSTSVAGSVNVATPAAPLAASSRPTSYPPGMYPTLSSVAPIDTTFINGPAPTGTGGAACHSPSMTLILALGAILLLIPW